jgi:hypothetical protein
MNVPDGTEEDCAWLQGEAPPGSGRVRPHDLRRRYNTAFNRINVKADDLAWRERRRIELAAASHAALAKGIVRNVDDRTKAC